MMYTSTKKNQQCVRFMPIYALDPRKKMVAQPRTPMIGFLAIRRISSSKIVVAASLCSPEDYFDANLGINKAVGRCRANHLHPKAPNITIHPQAALAMGTYGLLAELGLLTKNTWGLRPENLYQNNKNLMVLMEETVPTAVLTKFHPLTASMRRMEFAVNSPYLVYMISKER